MKVASDSLFHSLADPTRRGLFERLCCNGEMTVTALTREAGVSQPAVSKHLKILKRAGLVDDRPIGRNTHYRARREALIPLVDWASEMTSFWDTRLDRLDDLLKRTNQ